MLSIQQKSRFEISEISRARWNGTVHSGYRDPTEATARMVIVLVSRGQQFCQMERDLSVRPAEKAKPVNEDRLQSSSRIFRIFRKGPFHMMYQPNSGLNGKRPKMIRILINSSKSLLSKLFLVWSFFMTNSFGVLKTYTRWKWGLVPSCF